MNWTAIVPLKAAAERKTRLAGTLDGTALAALAERMAAHVIAALGQVPAIGSIRVLSPVPPTMPGAGWEADLGRGRNAELDRVCGTCIGQKLLIVHADLPLLSAEDVVALIAAAEQSGAAIAPDRHDRGTNALALREVAMFGCAFGPDSLLGHRQRLPGAAVVRRAGLALDIDTAEDMAAAGEALPLGRW